MMRPKIIINCAMSVDGKIALPSGTQMQISSEIDMKRVHHMRNSYDGVLVGIGAILSDDPKLTVKAKYVDQVRQPVRIVLDTHCQILKNALVVNDKAKTIICCNENPDNKDYESHVEILFCKTNQSNHLDLHDVLEKLYHKGIKSILVEGGGTVIWSFLKERLVDDFFVYIASIIIGGKQTPTVVDGIGITRSSEAIPLSLVELTQYNKGLLLHYQL